MDTPKNLLDNIADVIGQPHCDDVQQITHDAENQIDKVIQSLQEIKSEMKEESQTVPNPYYDEDEQCMVGGEELSGFRSKWIDRLGLER